MKETYELVGGGWVKFDWDKEVQAVLPYCENTRVVLTNGKVYVLRGRRYGV